MVKLLRHALVQQGIPLDKHASFLKQAGSHGYRKTKTYTTPGEPGPHNLTRFAVHLEVVMFPEEIGDTLPESLIPQGPGLPGYVYLHGSDAPVVNVEADPAQCSSLVLATLNLHPNFRI